ncbi:hypothetical protein V1521DRAFT_429096 [Lipomyces starkeyi]
MRVLYLGVLVFLYACRVISVSVDDCFAACGSAVVFASQCGTDTSCLCASGSGFVTTATTCLDCAGPNGANIWSSYEPFLTTPLATCGLPSAPAGATANTPPTSTTTVTSTSVVTSTITSTVVITSSSSSSTSTSIASSTSTSTSTSSAGTTSTTSSTSQTSSTTATTSESSSTTSTGSVTPSTSAMFSNAGNTFISTTVARASPTTTSLSHSTITSGSFVIVIECTTVTSCPTTSSSNLFTSAPRIPTMSSSTNSTFTSRQSSTTTRKQSGTSISASPSYTGPAFQGSAPRSADLPMSRATALMSIFGGVIVWLVVLM